MSLAKAYQLQDALNDLELIGYDLFDVLHYLGRFTHLYDVEWATAAPQVIDNFHPRRIRVWYRDEDQKVFAVMHG